MQIKPGLNVASDLVQVGVKLFDSAGKPVEIILDGKKPPHGEWVLAHGGVAIFGFCSIGLRGN